VAGDYKDLEVYQKAMHIGRVVHAVVADWPPLDQWTLGKQIIRSADSIAANIAEAYGRRTTRDREYFLHIARGSARETECLLEKAVERALIPGSTRLTPNEAAGVSMMLSRLIAAIRTRENQPD
jgi:four helix bundle protein